MSSKTMDMLHVPVGPKEGCSAGCDRRQVEGHRSSQGTVRWTGTDRWILGRRRLVEVLLPRLFCSRRGRRTVEGKSSVCVICMKFRIIIISLGQILLTHHTHARTHTPPFRLSLFDGSLTPNRDAVDASFRRVTVDQSWPVAGSFK